MAIIFIINILDTDERVYGSKIDSFSDNTKSIKKIKFKEEKALPQKEL